MKSGKAVDVMPKSLSTNNGDKGPFIQNMRRSLDGWEVRAGFGQLAQFDSTLSASTTNNKLPIGYTKQLGTYALRTSWGALQIVTVLIGKSNTSNIAEYGVYTHHYVVNIYDVTTGRRWEEILHGHAGDSPNRATPMPMWSGNYQTAANSNRRTFIGADVNDFRLFFCKATNDTLLFGSSSIGLWSYVPADFDKLVSRQTDALRLSVDCLPYAESSKVVRVAPGRGIYDGVSYLDSSSFPSHPTSVVQVENRFVLAKGRTIFISDTGRPGSVAALNIVDLPLLEDIVALGEFAGVLLIFSANETFAYRMSAGANVARGDLRRLSSDIGCLGPQAVTKADTGLVWCDKSGIYRFLGGSGFEPLSSGLKDMFEPGGVLSLPLTSFWTTQSASPASAYDQPRSFVQWGDVQTHLAYEQELGMLLITIPSQGSSLVLSRGAWSLFIYESIANEGRLIKTTTTIVEPHIAVSSGRIFSVCGPELYALPSGETTKSIAILEFGRGGAVDRTVVASDDMREFVGEYPYGTSAGHHIVLGRPTRHDASFKLPDARLTADGDIYLFPALARPKMQNPAAIEFEFNFDSSQWTPVFTSINGEVAAMFPSERSPSMYAWGKSNPTATSEIRCYQGGSVDESGDTIKAKFLGSRLGIQAWSEKPNMMLNIDRHCPLMWLPFAKTGAGKSEDLGVTGSLASLDGVNHDFIWWRSASVKEMRKIENQDATAVDWVLKSDQMESGDGEQIRVRGLRLSVLSHGESTDKIVAPSWPDSMMNVAFQADWRDWSGQVADLPNYEKKYGKNPLRSRFVLAGGTAYAGRVFNGEAMWSSPGLNDGDYLVDDEQRDRVSLSLSMRGERVSAMLFGHIKAVSARVVVTSMEAAVSVVGAARRWGR